MGYPDRPARGFKLLHHEFEERELQAVHGCAVFPSRALQPRWEERAAQERQLWDLRVCA